MKRVLGAAAVLMLLAVGCGDDGDASPDAEAAVTSSAAPSTTAPEAVEECTADRVGGTVTFGEFLQPRGLDPANSSAAAGVYGGSEMLAIYDTLLRYDHDTGQFEPHVAESLESNDDATEWTLTLQPDIAFGNGDPLTAEAVKGSLERHADPALRSALAGRVAQITEMRVVDDLTLEFVLASPWAGFPSLLAGTGGMIVNPAVAAQLGADFPLMPAGAGVGPYEPVAFRPADVIELQAKADYWGGPVCIEALRFVPLSGAELTYESLRQGQLQAAFIRDPAVVSGAAEDGTDMLVDTVNMGTTLAINHMEGRPGNDVRLRRAIAAAVDVDVVNERVWDGKGLTTSAMIYEESRWYDGLEGPQFDPEEATRLVEEVKAAGGLTGPLHFICGTDPTSSRLATTIQTMLSAVGIETTLDTATNSSQARLEGNFDLSCHGLNVGNAEPWTNLAAQLSSDAGSRNVFRFFNPEFDAALDELRAASTDEDKLAALAELQEIWNDQIPVLGLSALHETVMYSPELRGVVLGQDAVAYFSDAYFEQ
jgi:peptide/nickel transport system substrate-binding protein